MNKNKEVYELNNISKKYDIIHRTRILNIHKSFYKYIIYKESFYKICGGLSLGIHWESNQLL